MVDNDVPVQSEKKKHKTNKNKTKQSKKNNNQGDKKNVYYVNSKIKTSKSCLNYF